MKPLPTDRIAIGGLMRCCIATLETHLYTNGDGRPADRVKCAYHESWMLRGDDGVWRWDSESEGKVEP